MNKRLLLLSLIMVLVCIRCLTQSKKKVDYETEYQQFKSDRINLINEDGHKFYHVYVYPGDIAKNGNRAEIVVRFSSQNFKTYNYSWDFKISGRFHQTKKQGNHFLIAQWLNPPAKGQDWEDIKGKQGPPFYLSGVVKDDGLYIQIYYGLQHISRKVEAEIKIDTDKWYHVNVLAFWSTDNNGYAKVTLGDTTVNLKGANKYNDVSNTFKVGLYRNKDNQDTTETYIKNIEVYKIEK